MLCDHRCLLIVYNKKIIEQFKTNSALFGWIFDMTATIIYRNIYSIRLFDYDVKPLISNKINLHIL